VGGVLTKIKQILDNQQLIALVISPSGTLDSTTFYTHDNAILQVGSVLVNSRHPVKRHFHKLIQRSTIGTAEVLIIQEGETQALIYNDNLELISEETLRTGDIICLFSGGHAFESAHKCVMLEIKNGPFFDISEKVYF
jgi:hypothetical protein